MMPVIRVISLLFVIASPYLLYALAQTSRLHDAVRTGDSSRVLAALKPWKSIDGVNRDRATPLSIAIQQGNTGIAALLLDRGASLRVRTSDRPEIHHLLETINYKRAELAVLLLQRGASLDDGVALKKTISQVDTQMLSVLLKKRTRTPGTKAALQSALLDAALLSGTVPLEKRTALVDLLVDHGAEPARLAEDDRDIVGSLVFPRGATDAELVQHLVARGYSLDWRDDRKTSPLRDAAAAQNVKAVALFLRLGAHANDGGSDCNDDRCTGRRTALHAAVDLWSSSSKDPGASAEIVVLLIKHGAKPNVRDPEGYTPLFHAVRSDNYLGARQLLKGGADPEAGQSGKRPTDAARKAANPAYAELLREHAGSK